MSETKFERCPICKKLKKAAAICLTCGVTIISAADPNAHTHQEKFTLKPTTAIVTTLSSASDTGLSSNIFYKVPDMPESSERIVLGSLIDVEQNFAVTEPAKHREIYKTSRDVDVTHVEHYLLGIAVHVFAGALTAGNCEPPAESFGKDAPAGAIGAEHFKLSLAGHGRGLKKKARSAKRPGQGSHWIKRKDQVKATLLHHWRR